MFFRKDRYVKNENITEDTTFTKALPSAGLLDSIWLIVRVYNASAHYDRAKPNIWDHITKLVVKADGIENFMDVWGPTCLSQYAVEYGVLPPGFIDTMSSNYQTLAFPLLFGRKFQDGKFALDLSKYGETRLEITNDYATADLQTTADIWYDIDLHFLEEVTPPPFFLGTSQLASKTWTANSQEETWKVPKSRKVRRLFIGCESFRTSGTGSQGNKAWRNLRYLKYTYKSGALVVKDDDLYRSDQDNLWGYPDLVTIMKNCETRIGYTEDVGLCRPIVALATHSYSSASTEDTHPMIDQRQERLLTWRDCHNGHQARLLAKGYGVLDHFCIHEDRPDDIEGFLDPSLNADVEVKVGNSSSGGTTGILRFIAQTLRTNS